MGERLFFFFFSPTEFVNSVCFQANTHSPYDFQTPAYLSFCLNDRLVAKVLLHSPFTSTDHSGVPSKCCFTPRFECPPFSCYYSACGSGGFAFSEFLQVPPGHPGVCRCYRTLSSVQSQGLFTGSSPRVPLLCPHPRSSAPRCAPASRSSRAAFPSPVQFAGKGLTDGSPEGKKKKSYCVIIPFYL